MTKEFAKTRKRNPDGTFAVPTIPSRFNKKEYKKNYNKIHSKERIEKAVEWGRKNKEKRKLIRKRWVENNREKVNFLKRAYMYRRKQQLKSSPFPTLKQIDLLYKKFYGLCIYCNLSKATTIDHIIPLSRKGTNELDNLAPSCLSCNSSKGAKLLKEWKPEIYEV